MKTTFVLFFFPLAMFAHTNSLSGNARMDLLSVSEQDSLPQPHTVMVQNDAERSKLKKPLLGGAMSLLVPGAGEYYSGRFLKSGVFFAVEVVAVTAAVFYNNKGNNKTTEFQNYADQHWSAVKYAQWILANGGNYEVSGVTYPTFTINPNTSLPSWQRVDFSAINAWEAEPHSIGFTHLLPPHGDQQYYELIGKYSQFKYGWDTYQGPNGDPQYDDGYDVNFIPQQMKDYAANRGKANDFYYSASVATAIVVVNHIISALDGAWSTSNYNKEVESEMGMHLQDVGGGELTLMTQLTVKVKL
ncbi:MAG TPA: hypothetical protein VMM58_06485 [Bacteroidota bacterium]|nr:hypothetical protein [Bacteroidota bacterium]